MNFRNLLSVFLVLLIAQFAIAQKNATDANIIGHVTSKGEHLSFATITLAGTTIGTTTDETGHFQLIHMPVGEQTLVVSMVGYKPYRKTLTLVEGKTVEVKVELEEDMMNIEEIVVSSDRAAQRRIEAPVIVNTISPELFKITSSATLGEGLSFSPGLRLENNCQNCGFSQVRMNGMEGPYSQILINSRPIFSGLAGVYGLELIPANMIEKVEIVRGGGSALYGSNAIAGTINILMKEPMSNTYEGGFNYGLIGVGIDGSGDAATDLSTNFNASVVSIDNRSGISVYGFKRKRDAFDANGDDFSEISALDNLTFGAKVFHRFNYRDKLAFDFFAIQEQRDGGNKQELPLHERDISESLTHKMNVIGTTYDRFFRKADKLSFYASAQFLNRDSYYGAGRSLTDYGNSVDHSYNAGVQYKAQFDRASLVAGIENTGGFLKDKKLGYREFTIVDGVPTETHIGNTTVADQSSVITGIFAQYEIKLNKLKIAAGARFDHYKIEDKQHGGEAKDGNVFNPRLSLMYDFSEAFKARLSYSQGYRAPQIYDEDLHIETSGARQITHTNDPDLKQETSHSYMASVDFNKQLGSVYVGFLVEGFYTQLNDAFGNTMEDGAKEGQVVYTRINSSGAKVNGLNVELRLKPKGNFSFTSGLTFQKSEYEEEQEDFPEKRFFRTPDNYGFFAIDWDFAKNFCFSATGNYTGSMLVPYFGTQCKTDEEGEPIGELKESDSFFDFGAKLSYTMKLSGASMELSAGVKNLFNAYQDDFDVSEDRDPAYIYGPVNPRTIYFSIKFGNIL